MSEKCNSNIRACFLCKSNEKDELYNIWGRDEWICRDCLDDSSEYGKCFSCEREGIPRAYDISELREGDDGNFYCKEHCADGDDPPSDDVMDYMEHARKD